MIKTSIVTLIVLSVIVSSASGLKVSGYKEQTLGVKLAKIYKKIKEKGMTNERNR